MEKESQAVIDDLRQLFDDTKLLLSVTADVASDKVKDARKRLSGALERAMQHAGDSNAIKAIMGGAKEVDKALRENPYPSIATSLGIGVLIGFIVGGKR